MGMLEVRMGLRHRSGGRAQSVRVPKASRRGSPRGADRTGYRDAAAQPPQQPGAVVFDHQYDHPLVEAEESLGNPAVWSRFADRLVEAAGMNRFVSGAWLVARQAAQRRQDDFRCERQ
jgi:hypothetical protein